MVPSYLVKVYSSSIIAPQLSSTESADSFRPSRRVRQGPGGNTHNIFEEEFPDDALALAPETRKVRKTRLSCLQTVT